jgi:hypothetical protein
MSTYLQIAGDITRLRLMGVNPKIWPVSPDDLNQLSSELGKAPTDIFGVPLILLSQLRLDEAEVESNHSKLQQVSERPILNEARLDASTDVVGVATDEQVAHGGAPTTVPISAE